MVDVSVIVTLYNYRHYVVDAVQSFLSQDFPNSEMVIVDDASTDNPMEVLEPLLSERVRYIPLEKNGGYSHAKNVGIKASVSEVLVMLDADDMLTTTSISSRYAKMQEGYDFVHGPALDLKDGNLSLSRMWPEWKRKGIFKYVHAQSVMLRKEIHRKIGLYDETLRCKSDREMFARVFHHNFRIGVVKTPVAVYRNHPLQMHKSREKLKINEKLQKEVLRRIEVRKTDLTGLEMLE